MESYSVKLYREDLGYFRVGTFKSYIEAAGFAFVKNGSGDSNFVRYAGGSVVIFKNGEEFCERSIVPSGVYVYETWEENSEQRTGSKLYSSVEKLYSDIIKYADKNIYTVHCLSHEDFPLTHEGILAALFENEGLVDWSIDSEDINKNGEMKFAFFPIEECHKKLYIYQRLVL